MGIARYSPGTTHHHPIPNPQSPIPHPQSPMPNAQSPIPNPQSPIPNPQSPIPTTNHQPSTTNTQSRQARWRDLRQQLDYVQCYLCIFILVDLGFTFVSSSSVNSFCFFPPALKRRSAMLSLQGNLVWLWLKQWTHCELSRNGNGAYPRSLSRVLLHPVGLPEVPCVKPCSR